ncbi:MAG TPA: hypothetical protein PKX92_06200 [Edaphocola sp.]|nr:hypothetical protein [Edaphocola sp.]
MLLLLFLLPTVTELVHNFVHKDDVHCIQTGLHFHQTEHHCAIDDFVPFVSDIPTYRQFSIYILKVETKYLYFYKTLHVSEAYKCHFSLRGPPIIG